MTVKPPLKWHGGKHYLASEIVQRIPAHIHYVEPFFGSGAVLFRKPLKLIVGYSEVINDIHRELTTFYYVLRNEKLFKQFKQRLDLTPLSEVEWAYSHEVGDSLNHVSRAVKFFVRYRQSRQGIGKSFATLSRNRTRRGMNEQAASWLTSVECLEEAHKRLQRVVVLNQHATDVITTQDGSNTFFYLDPPYLQSTRTAPNVYEHEMSANEHRTMLEVLSNLEGKFLLSGYAHPLYNDFATRYNWIREDFPLPNAASGAQFKELRVESLWRNF